jgi:hypothetical protein
LFERQPPLGDVLRDDQLGCAAAERDRVRDDLDVDYAAALEAVAPGSRTSESLPAASTSPSNRPAFQRAGCP